MFPHTNQKRPGITDGTLNGEQVKGIEPSTSAWEADVLPLNYTCTYKETLIQLYEGFGCG